MILAAFAYLSHAGMGDAVRPYQSLHIPEALSGTRFDLRLHSGRHSFWSGAETATYSYNKEPFWGPTLMLNKGEQVSINVTNELSEPTTVHWHGMHIPAKEDGGPHQLIPPQGIWTSTFRVANNAATYWYHPHPHESTQKQLTMGAGGLIIVRDAQEAKLNLPRTYGVDDIPLVFTSRRFTKSNEFSYQGDWDKYGDFLLCNGTLDPQVSLPAQWVRLRVLNAEVERGYDLGFKDNRYFYLIATDGGLVDRPVRLNRLRLMVGERAEIMVNLGPEKVGASLDLYSYNKNQPFGFPGGEPGNYSPNGSYLNNRDFPLLHINVVAATPAGSGTLPERLASNQLWKESDASVQRSVSINGGGPPQKEFQFGGRYFDMDRVDQVVKLGSVECWTVKNDRVFGHSFHIHDVQFSLIERNGEPVDSSERGWKDTAYIPRNGSIKFVAKFDDFASDKYAYMYHCHMSNHEDGGLMGQFLVVDGHTQLSRDSNGEVHLSHSVDPERLRDFSRSSLPFAPKVAGLAQPILQPTLVVLLERDCPCSRELAVYVNRIAIAFKSRASVLGMIDAAPPEVQTWSKGVAAQFSVFPDPNLSVAKAFDAKYSASLILIRPGGKIVRIYPGYSAAWLEEITSRLSSMTGNKKLLSFSEAPRTPRAGCVLVATK